MSELKHKTLKELLESKAECEERIAYHGNHKSVQEERLKWIDKYIQEKTHSIKEGIVYERFHSSSIFLVTLIKNNSVYSLYTDGSFGKRDLRKNVDYLRDGTLVPRPDITPEEFVSQYIRRG